MHGGHDVEVMDAINVDDRLRFEQRYRRRATTAPTVGQVARAVVATYAAWVFCWWLVRTGIPPPHGLEWFRALLVHLPTPPPF